MTQHELAEMKLREMLQAAHLPVKASYHPGEICQVLGVSARTFWRLVRQYERDADGHLHRPDCLDSTTLARHRRVSYGELVAFLFRNNSYERAHAVHPDQMALFAS